MPASAAFGRAVLGRACRTVCRGEGSGSEELSLGCRPQRHPDGLLRWACAPARPFGVLLPALMPACQRALTDLARLFVSSVRGIGAALTNMRGGGGTWTRPKCGHGKRE